MSEHFFSVMDGETKMVPLMWAEYALVQPKPPSPDTEGEKG
jgi:hypothetical protein